MIYTSVFPALITGNEKIFELARDGKARLISLINISVAGTLLGLSNLVGTLQTESIPLSGSYGLLVPGLFILYGICTIIGVLLGLCLVYWAGAKAFGGVGGFGFILDLIGVSAVPFWLLAPLLNYFLQFEFSQATRVLLVIAIAGSFIWSFILLRQSLIFGQGLSVGRATLALGAMWIFSLSAVYLFLP